MTQEIKLTTDQMKLMSLFQNVTKATARDCIEDEKRDRIIFVVNEGKMGLAIGKGGAHIKSLQSKIDRSVELVEYNEDPIQLLKNILNEKYITDIKISERLDVNLDECMMVGDWPDRDIKGANELGMKTAFARYGSTEDVAKSGANHDLDSLSELIDVIKSYNDC